MARDVVCFEGVFRGVGQIDRDGRDVNESKESGRNRKRAFVGNRETR